MCFLYTSVAYTYASDVVEDTGFDLSHFKRSVHVNACACVPNKHVSLALQGLERIG